MLPLFVYGTLQDSDIRAAVLGRALAASALVQAYVEDFACLYYPGRVYPALAARPGARTGGLILIGLTDADLAALDAFEGKQYGRSTITVTTVKETLRAHVYLPTLNMPADALPWRFDHWVQRHKPAVLAAETELARGARRKVARQASAE